MTPATAEMFCDQPNKFARPAKLELYDNSVVFHGYQEFLLMENSITVLAEDHNLARKQELLSRFFCPRYLARRTVLDLGASSGFFCFWALQNGASQAFAVDIDEQYLRQVEAARAKLGYHNLVTTRASVVDWEQPGDVVLALALVHWVYSCTALFGSLDAVLGRLARLSNYMLIVEWVDPEDPAIVSFRHLDWNEEKLRAPYTLTEFEAALTRHFSRYEVIGEVTPTRKLYAAFRHPFEIDLSVSLPLAGPIESIFSGRKLTRCEGIDYWSYLFDGGDVIHKQATLDLAEREAHFLTQLTGIYFPRVLEVKAGDEYSVITLEKISGLPLEKCYADINAGRGSMHNFFQHALDLLVELKEKGIVHRDIGPENILVRDSRPVLLDFGWAIYEQNSYVSPLELGGDGRPPDKSFCDVYSMGNVFDQINQHKYADFDTVIELMKEPDPSLRITDLVTLKILFASVNSSPLDDAGATEMDTNGVEGQGPLNEEPASSKLAINQLLKQLEKRKQRLGLLRSENEQLAQQLAHDEHALRLSQDQLQELQGRVQLVQQDLLDAQLRGDRAEERIDALSAELLATQTQLRRITGTLAWRLLNRSGLLTVYRLIEKVGKTSRNTQ